MSRVAWQALAAAALLALGGCATRPPARPDDVCAVFEQRPAWYRAARRAEQRWATPIPILMAFTREESAFQASVRPPRRRILWLIPGWRPSSAYGYAQATDEAWADYRRASGRGGADRDDFGDALDFIGWYNDVSGRTLGIARDDARSLYLAYHEGHSGYRAGGYRNDARLQALARRVADRAAEFKRQLARCAGQLQASTWWPFQRSIDPV